MSAKRKKDSGRVVALRPRQEKIPAIAMHMGTIVGRSAAGILVDYRGNPLGPLPALSTIALSATEIDALMASQRPVLLAFEGDCMDRPILMGLTQPIARPEARTPRAIDGDVISLKANERVEIRCGEGSIILTKEGKIIVNGTYVSVGSDGALILDGAAIKMN